MPATADLEELQTTNDQIQGLKNSYIDRAGAGLDRVEREDESIIETVQRGVKSKFYQAGRFSPTRETGVHHFHRLLSRFISE